MSRRIALAAVLLAGVLGALLVAWFASGWSEVRARRREAIEAPQRDADRRAAALAHDLRSELGGLVSREGERPYFHYQNLVHEPGASVGLGVAPSPLARGSQDALVLGYFQLDDHARATTPTINDELPELSEPTQLAAHRAFRDEVGRSLATQLRPREAIANAQVVTIDRNSYSQNVASNQIFQQQRRAPPVAAPVAVPPDAPPADARSRVAITVAALEWRTLAFAGQPSMIAARQVHTPDGALVQGFVVDRGGVARWLAERAGDLAVELRPGDDDTAEVAPGWHLAARASPSAVAVARTTGDALARGFLARFVAVGALALAMAMFVVWLVARAERLARERSQFAAAAAHELRTPLAGLQLYGDMIADGLGDPRKLRDYARRMSEEAARLGRVVSNVLGFSQLERGNLSVDAQPGALSTALRALAEGAADALARAGATLVCDVPDDLAARFDRDALARIIGNLLDNAEKYGRLSADRTIALAARAVDDGVEVAVRDRGPGVAAPARLFRPFARGVASDGPAGLGLGLALSRSLARAMGGDLVHRAPAGGGAELVLRLARA